MNELNNETKEEQNRFLSYEAEKKQIIPKIHPIAAAFIGLIGGFFLYQVVGGLLTGAVFGFDLENAPANSLRLMTTAGQILFILLPALLLALLIYEDVTEIIRVRAPNWILVLLFLVGIFVLSPLLQSYLYIQNFFIDQLAEKFYLVRDLKELVDSLNTMMEKSYANLIRTDNFAEGILVVIVIALTPAVCEEVMFRGFIQRSFEFKLKPVWAAFITAVFFGLSHFNVYGTIPLIALGFYFGFAAYISNSIFIPVILHFVNNLTAVVLYFFFGEEDLLGTGTPPDFQLESTLVTFFIFLILFSGVILLIRYYSRTKKISPAG